MRKTLTVLLIAGCTTLLSLTIAPRHDRSIGVEHALLYFKEESVQFAKTLVILEWQINRIKKNDLTSLSRAKMALKDARLQYKNIEFFLNYFFSSTSIIYNAAPVPEVEEPFLEYRDPTGLQVIEQLLFSADPAAQKKELQQQVSLIRTSAEDLNSLLFNLAIDDKRLLESLRLELITIITQGISGFDAPELKSGIKEARQALAAIQANLSPYLEKGVADADSINYYLRTALQLTKANDDFDSFDRLSFLTTAALPLQQHLNLLIKRRGLEVNTTGSLNYDADDLFSGDAINLNSRLNASPALAALGRKLFFEKGLSGNNSRSCATCHRPEKYFADGLCKSIAMDGVSTVQRNAPGLFYSVFQSSQFWDGRVKSFEEQINSVLNNPIEMNGDHQLIVQRLKENKQYRDDFANAFPKAKEESVSVEDVVEAISEFLKTLAPFNSAFDRYLRGDRTALTDQQIQGFNLFTGKALCGTCHTMPLFNGLLPPLYKKTSIEVLGTTKDANFKTPHLDSDSGKYLSYSLPFYLGAFKTPGLRNVAMTAPYMHNGEFPTLESVLEFYNKGGGRGMGLRVPYQTLASTPLKLTEAEIGNIISFLNSLTDSLPPEDKLAASN